MTFLRLISTEARRFQARRAMRWLFGLGLLVALIVNAVQLGRSEVATSYERGVAFGSIPDNCRRGTREGLPLLDLGCADRAGVGVDVGLGPDGPPLFGEDTTPVMVRRVRDRQVRVGRTYEETLRGLGIAVTLLGVLVGSTFLAAEFGAAGLSTQLLFEPRRVRLYAAKTLGLFLGSALSAAMLVVWTGLLQFAASALRGSTAGVDAGWLVERLGDVARVAATCGLAAVCALAVGSVARRTVVAVGIFFGLVVGTGFLGGVSWGKPLARVSPMNSLFATGFADLHDPDGFFGLHTLTGAVVVTVTWAAAFSVVGGWWFARREIR